MILGYMVVYVNVLLGELKFQMTVAEGTVHAYTVKNM